MRSLLLHSAVLCCCLLGLEGTFVEQTPRYAAVSPGTTEFIRCILKDKVYLWMSWYLQDANGQLENLFVIRTTGDKEKVVREAGTYEAVRVSDTELSLRIDNASISHFIYCTCSRAANKLYFGQGTKLTVLEDGLKITAPKVALFDPSPQEVKERGSATLVCLATNFYPDHVVLSWSVNGVERMEGVKTDDQPTRGSDKMYSLSSRLRVSKKEWLNPETAFRCKVYFDPTKQNITMETKGREGCGGVTAESYRKSANTAKFTYVLLITKSAFYGVLVTLIAWKIKLNGGKNIS